MKTRNLSAPGVPRRWAAFSMLELIGALAVLALLLAAIIPTTINCMMESKAVATVTEYQDLYAAATNHIAAYGSFGVAGPLPTTGVSIPYTNWDLGVLIQQDKFLTERVKLPIGTSFQVNIEPGPSAGGTNGYYLYSQSVNSSAAMTYVLEIQIVGVPEELAFDVATILNGTVMTPTNKVQSIRVGKVVYDGSSIMYLYVANSN